MRRRMRAHYLVRMRIVIIHMIMHHVLSSHSNHITRPLIFGPSPADMQRGCPLADMQGDCPLADLQGEPYIGMSPISLNCRLCAFHNRGRGNTDLVDIQSILVGRLHTRSMGRRSNENNLDHLAYFVLSAFDVVAAATLVELNAFWRADCTLGR